MAEHGPDITQTPGLPVESPQPRRIHTYSRLTTALAVLAFAIGGYTLFRLDVARDRLDTVRDTVRTLEADRAVLRAELKSLATRQRQATRELDKRLDAFGDVPQQMEDLASSVEELRGRAEGPERAWSRAEAIFLLDLAQRRLALDRDVETAIVALESADARLASLRDQSLAPVRQHIAREVQALRAVRLPDTTGIIARLAGAEERAASLPLRGIVVDESKSATDALPTGMFARAWALVRNTFSNLIVVRRVDERAGSVLTRDEALLRRQHLQLLLFSARTAVARHDRDAFRTALARTRHWLGDFFDLSAPAAQALLDEVQSLEPIDIDPPLPDISASSKALHGLMPTRRGPE
jgi:uroporphyrin-III C-methyltransferase